MDVVSELELFQSKLQLINDNPENINYSCEMYSYSHFKITNYGFKRPKAKCQAVKKNDRRQHDKQASLR